MKDEYIGRNALLSIITTKFNEHYGNACYQFIHDFYRFVIRKICAAPAADVVEVRHGRWDDSGRYKFPNGETAVCCTECGCALRKKEYENNNWFYCPVCGALMDKEE